MLFKFNEALTPWVISNSEESKTEKSEVLLKFKILDMILTRTEVKIVKAQILIIVFAEDVTAQVNEIKGSCFLSS